MTRLRSVLLVLTLLVFSSQSIAHDHLSDDLEMDPSCLVCSYSDSVPLTGPVSLTPLWADPAGAKAWPPALGPTPRDCPKDYLSRGPPFSR
ncbi:MAG TPA: hypothetical protein VIS55_00550 [Pseudomonadales bacterium]